MRYMRNDLYRFMTQDGRLTRIIESFALILKRIRNVGLSKTIHINKVLNLWHCLHLESHPAEFRAVYVRKSLSNHWLSSRWSMGKLILIILDLMNIYNSSWIFGRRGTFHNRMFRNMSFKKVCSLISEMNLLKMGKLSYKSLQLFEKRNLKCWWFSILSTLSKFNISVCTFSIKNLSDWRLEVNTEYMNLTREVLSFEKGEGFESLT